MPAAFTDERPLIFGEVLFDTFPDGSEVLGGAPFNVAWHLQGFGIDPLMISRVGCDARGDRIRATMQDWGMTTDGLQLDDDHPTGIVSVALNQGQPSFDIVADQAYDHIDADAALRAVGANRVGLIYHGTLALRQSDSRDALDALRRVCPVPACVDINLRAPWWERNRIIGLLHAAAWVKLNDAELEMVTGETLADRASLEQAADVLRRRHDIGILLVTLGAKGAFVLADGELHRGEPAPVGQLVDTVGAGDAFSAVSMLGLVNDWPPTLTLERALEFASAVCGMRGATTTDRALYERFTKKWENDAHGQA